MMISKLRRRMNFVSEEDGFTLIELMVVIAVLGILAGIAIPKLGGVKDKAKEAALNTIAGTIRTGMEMYNAQENGYPSTGKDLSGSSGFGTLKTELAKVGVELEAPDVLQQDSGDDANDNDEFTYSADDDQYLIQLPSTASGTIYYVGDEGVGTSNTEATSGGSVQ